LHISEGDEVEFAVHEDRTITVRGGNVAHLDVLGAADA
jgi:hypothetical protein